MSNNIDASNWTLFDKVMYGGLGYSTFCLPTDFFKVIITILFPPLGEIINILEDDITDTFPWITWDAMKKLCTYKSLNTIVYSFLLTTLFYIPGLVYTLTNIVEKERKVNYDVKGQTIYEGVDAYGEQVRITKTTVDNVVYIKEVSSNGIKTLFKKPVADITEIDQNAINGISKSGKQSLNILNNVSNIGSDIGSGFEKTGSAIGGLF